MLKGAWPVFGFFGLDVLLVYIFFKINFISGKKKEVIIGGKETNLIHIKRFLPSLFYKIIQNR